MQTIRVQSRWQVPGQSEQPCTINLERYDGMDQLWKAFKSGGLFLLLAAATVPIPIVHLFVPPLCLAIAVFMVARSLTLHEIAVSASGVCTQCQKQVEAQLGNVKPRYPLWTLCPDCRERLRVLEPAAQAA